MNEAIKHDDDKLRFDLVPPHALQEVVAVYTMGAKKYGDRNWEQGLAWGRVFGAIMRHLWAWWAGEDNDPESGLSHLAHAAWGCLALLEYQHTHPELDDRPLTTDGKKENRRVPADPPPRYDDDFHEIGRILEEKEDIPKWLKEGAFDLTPLSNIFPDKVSLDVEEDESR